MKKNLLLIISLFIIANVAISQTAITITQSDFPVVGNQAIEAKDTVCTGVTVGTSGAQQTWSFTNIVNMIQDTTTFVTPGTLAGASNFPTSNIAAVNPGGEGAFYYSGTSSFDLLGMYADFGPPLGYTAYIMNPSQKMFSLPATYQTTFSGTSSFTITIPFPQPPYVDSMKMTMSITYSGDVDGWGTVTTPAYTNIACLRQKNTSINSSQAYMHNTLLGWQAAGGPTVDTAYTYFWCTNTAQYPIATVEATGSGTITDAKYLLNPQTGIASNVHQSKNNVTIYPNPASDNINISGITGISAMVITDISGRAISNTFLYKNNTSINISNLNNGIYFYNIFDINGKSISKGKFVVTK